MAFTISNSVKAAIWSFLAAIFSMLLTSISTLTSGNVLYEFLISLVVFFLTYGIKFAEYEEGLITPPAPATPSTPPNPPVVPSITTSSVPAITYQLDGQTITVPLNGPLGQNDVINGQTFTIGQQISAAATVNGTNIPLGAVYLGDGVFELNGNDYDTGEIASNLG